MIAKKLGAVILIGIFLTSALPSLFLLKADASYLTFSPESGNKTSDQIKTDPSLSTESAENIINIIKNKITIPSDLTEVTYQYSVNGFYLYKTWALSWYSKDRSKTLSVNCRDNGSLISYNYKTDKTYTPIYQPEELKGKADEFLKKAAPEIAGKLRFDYHTNGLSGTYHYFYQRMENGLPVYNVNSVIISVNYQTGEIMYYDSPWQENLAFSPNIDAKISKEEAIARYSANLKINLHYRLALVTTEAGKHKLKAFIVYSPDISSAAVDAITGEYDAHNIRLPDDYEVMVMRTNVEEGNAKSLGLINKNTAIRLIKENKNLLFEKDLNIYFSALYKVITEGNESGYEWQLDFRDKTNSNSQVYCTIDAKTGNLINYHSNVKQYSDYSKKEQQSLKTKVTQKQGKALLERFLKEQASDCFKNTAYSSSEGTYVLKVDKNKKIYGGYYYNYQRVNEGMPYFFNDLSGAVDCVTGKIYNYQKRWYPDMTFESPTNILSKEQALKVCLSGIGCELGYEVIYKGDQDYSVRLIYKSDKLPDNISAITGQKLDLSHLSE